MGIAREQIDWEQLDMMADGYTPDFVEIFLEFLAQTQEMLDALDQHLLEGNVVGVRDSAHKVKGSAANFGFLGVSQPMADIELQVKEKSSLEGSVERLSDARKNFELAREEVRSQRGI